MQLRSHFYKTAIHQLAYTILEIWLNTKRRHTSGKAPWHKAYNLLNIFP
jgi:hypothetical protein